MRHIYSLLSSRGRKAGWKRMAHGRGLSQDLLHSRKVLSSHSIRHYVEVPTKY